MKTIPLKSIPSQVVKTVLDDQNIKLKVYQKDEGLFVDVTSDGVDVVVAVLAHDADPIVCIQYTGFAGNFVFIDTQGDSDPTYSTLGTRHNLVYLTAEEYALV